MKIGEEKQKEKKRFELKQHPLRILPTNKQLYS